MLHFMNFKKFGVGNKYATPKILEWPCPSKLPDDFYLFIRSGNPRQETPCVSPVKSIADLLDVNNFAPANENINIGIFAVFKDIAHFLNGLDAFYGAYGVDNRYVSRSIIILYKNKRPRLLTIE